MQTTADEHRDAALDYLQKSIEQFSEIIVNRCTGSDEYNIDYRARLRASLHELIEIRDRFL